MSTATGERRLMLAATRGALHKLPCNEFFELPGRPHVMYQLRSYANAADAADAALQARNEVPFLFKAFETGQIGPKRLAKMHGGKPRMATIHEYLDWTVTASSADADDELVGLEGGGGRCKGGGGGGRRWRLLGGWGRGVPAARPAAVTCCACWGAAATCCCHARGKGLIKGCFNLTGPL